MKTDFFLQKYTLSRLLECERLCFNNFIRMFLGAVPDFVCVVWKMCCPHACRTEADRSFPHKCHLPAADRYTARCDSVHLLLSAHTHRAVCPFAPYCLKVVLLGQSEFCSCITFQGRFRILLRRYLWKSLKRPGKGSKQAGEKSKKGKFEQALTPLSLIIERIALILQLIMRMAWINIKNLILLRWTFHCKTLTR